MKTKIIKYHSGSNTATQNIQIEIPFLCPRCEVSNNPINQHVFVHSYESSVILVGFTHRCTGCDRYSLTLQRLEGKTGSLVSQHPSTKNRTFDDLITAMSPRFVDLYNQAQTAEELNHIDLAGMGYRASLEVLIKDYALDFELDSIEEIGKLNLNRAIGKYFKSDDSIISADVVRKLGNDYAHWEKSNEDLPISVLKTYLEIFIKQIEVKLMLKNPPVPTRVPQ